MNISSQKPLIKNIIFNVSDVLTKYIHGQPWSNSLLAEEAGISLICLPEETGLMIEHGTALCVGTKPRTLYSRNGTQRIINPEESFDI